jgi:hypothetical protein
MNDKENEIAKIKMNTAKSITASFKAYRNIPFIGLHLFECSVYALLAAEREQINAVKFYEPDSENAIKVNIVMKDGGDGLFDTILEADGKFEQTDKDDVN